MRSSSTIALPSVRSNLTAAYTPLFNASSQIYDVVRFAVAALLVPQISTLLLYFAMHSGIYFRGWANSEYLFLLCIGFLAPSRRMIALLTIELVVALVEPIAHLYYFSPLDALYSLRYLALLPWSRLAELGCILAIYIVGSMSLIAMSIGCDRTSKSKTLVYLTLVCALVPAAVDIANGRLRRSGIPVGRELPDVRTIQAARTPVFSLIRALRRDYSKIGAPTYRRIQSALTHAMVQLPQGQRPDIVLVLTESWGLAFDDRINQAQLQSYRSPEIQRLYRLQTATVNFSGATTAGETRELCEDPQGYFGDSRPAGFFAACWPLRLAHTGYHTVAAHGFTSTMFNRELWYQRLGFQQTAFLPDLEREGVAVCDGAFPGACDHDVAEWVGERLLNDRKRDPVFIHWVTLNSHPPVAALPPGASTEQCFATGIAQDQALCSWFLHVLTVHKSVAELAARPGLRPTVFVIVGDHAPPFIRPDDRNRFSQISVPYVVLMPRSIPLIEPAALPAEATGNAVSPSRNGKPGA